MVLKSGDKIHVIARRRFEEDVRRHFAGVVIEATDFNARIEGYAYVLHKLTQEYVRHPERRTRIIGLTDNDLIINVLPPEIDIEQLEYREDEQHHLVICAGSFSLDINEFGLMR